MAGYKKRRAFWAMLDAYGEERVLEDIAGGMTIQEVSDVFGMSVQMFYLWLKQDAERGRVYREMRQAMASGILDEALAIADGATNETLGVDRERIRIRTWLAERWNREEYGAPQAVPAVVLSVGSLHLTALREGALVEGGEPNGGQAALGTGEIVVEP